MWSIRINVIMCIKISICISRAFQPVRYPATCWTELTRWPPATSTCLQSLCAGQSETYCTGHSATVPAHSGPVLGRPLSTLSQLSVQLRRLYRSWNKQNFSPFAEHRLVTDGQSSTLALRRACNDRQQHTLVYDTKNWEINLQVTTAFEQSK